MYQLKMCAVPIFLLAIILVLAGAAAECEMGWTIYKDELCVKAFPNLVTYDEAKEFCATQNEGSNKASLVMVKNEDLQNILANITNSIVNAMWLGGKFNEATGEYKWDDGDRFIYTNWQDGYPRNNSNTACVELRPISSKAKDINAEAKWADASCQKEIQIMCQRAASWGLQDAKEKIRMLLEEIQTTNEKLKKAHGDLEETTNELEKTNQELDTTREELHSGSYAFPVGAIYIEYNDQPNPRKLWPSLVWEDVSSLYAGLFFRVTGGNSGNWGEIQADCAPRINQTSWTWSETEYPNETPIPADGWSNFAASGHFYYYTSIDFYDGMRFYTAGCEVRPRNQPVRVWKRIQ